MAKKFSRVKAFKRFVADLKASGIDTRKMPKLIYNINRELIGMKLVDADKIQEEMKMRLIGQFRGIAPL